jgi:hypothetical protein
VRRRGQMSLSSQCGISLGAIQFRKMIDYVVDNNGKISFSLEGIGGADRIASGELTTGRTAQELQYVCGSPAAKGITTFYGGLAPC